MSTTDKTPIPVTLVALDVDLLDNCSNVFIGLVLKILGLSTEMKSFNGTQELVAGLFGEMDLEKRGVVQKGRVGDPVLDLVSAFLLP